jgi:hypothetical protein
MSSPSERSARGRRRSFLYQSSPNLVCHKELWTIAPWEWRIGYLAITSFVSTSQARLDGRRSTKASFKYGLNFSGRLTGCRTDSSFKRGNIFSYHIILQLDGYHHLIRILCQSFDISHYQCTYRDLPLTLGLLMWAVSRATSTFGVIHRPNTLQEAAYDSQMFPLSVDLVCYFGLRTISGVG